jgi:hypothetical protein
MGANAPMRQSEYPYENGIYIDSIVSLAHIENFYITYMFEQFYYAENFYMSLI